MLTDAQGELPGMPAIPPPAPSGRRLIYDELVWIISSPSWDTLPDRSQRALRLAVQFLRDDLALNPGQY